jgi:hypothetical protein
MSPSKITSRLGLPPPELTGHHGLFVREVALNEFRTGVGRVEFIEPAPYDKSYDNILVKVSFDAKDLTKTELLIERETGGYYAAFLQPILHLANEKARDELIDEHIRFLNKNMQILSKEVHNDDAESYGIRPFRVITKVKTDAFVEKAGGKFLFKLGELIGPQVEMYQERERKLPVESQFNRGYARKIVVEIPAGYRIHNLEGIDIHNAYATGGDTLFLFHSAHALEGSRLTVTADEYYKVMDVELPLFEQYRTVINSAADFNKVTLLIEPE